MSAKTEYQRELAGLAGAVGSRNSRLLRIANFGILAGCNPGILAQEIQAASGSPPLGEREVRRAVERAASDTTPHDFQNYHVRMCAPTRPASPRPRWERGASAFVRAMCAAGQGADMDTLTALSTVPIPEAPEGQAAVFLQRLYVAGEHVFIGEQRDTARLGDNLRTREAWLEASSPVTLAPQVMANPVTGGTGETKEGRPSSRCLACIAAFRYALVEFDAMPIEDQLAFWAGVVKRDALPVASLVYSGGKSVHGLLRLDAGSAAQWGTLWRDLERLLCSQGAPPEAKADSACKDATRLTRLPGATRRETGRLQSLLWLA